ncbi:streptophobe family protein [Streptomyces sp. ISL-96]|uniref:streptophobe family protein n=1 Tax=Streptomyces sp. ISL-96 TaxID=2819191 RepID=UPI0035ABB889
MPGGDAPGGIGGLLPDGLADLADAKASVGFSVNAGESLVGAACWVLGVLVVALPASRRTPLPRGWEAAHRVVRPAASALVTVLVVAVSRGSPRRRTRRSGTPGATIRSGSRVRRCSARPTGCGWGSRSGCSCRGTAG